MELVHEVLSVEALITFSDLHGSCEVSVWIQSHSSRHQLATGPTTNRTHTHGKFKVIFLSWVFVSPDRRRKPSLCREPKIHTGRTCKLHTEWSRAGIKPMTKYTNAKAKEKTNKKNTKTVLCLHAAGMVSGRLCSPIELAMETLAAVFLRQNI